MVKKAVSSFRFQVSSQDLLKSETWNLKPH